MAGPATLENSFTCSRFDAILALSKSNKGDSELPDGATKLV
jgi:hypothetical protein